MLYNLVENHFKTITKLKSGFVHQKFRSSIVPLFLINQLIHKLSQDPNIMHDRREEEDDPIPTPKLNFHNAAMLISRMLSHKNKILSKIERRRIKQSDDYKKKLKEYEERAMELAPQIENRIVCIRDQEVNRILKSINFWV